MVSTLSASSTWKGSPPIPTSRIRSSAAEGCISGVMRIFTSTTFAHTERMARCVEQHLWPLGDSQARWKLASKASAPTTFGVYSEMIFQQPSDEVTRAFGDSKLLRQRNVLHVHLFHRDSRSTNRETALNLRKPCLPIGAQGMALRMVWPWHLCTPNKIVLEWLSPVGTGRPMVTWLARRIPPPRTVASLRDMARWFPDTTPDSG